MEQGVRRFWKVDTSGQIFTLSQRTHQRLCLWRPRGKQRGRRPFFIDQLSVSCPVGQHDSRARCYWLEPPSIHGGAGALTWQVPGGITGSRVAAGGLQPGPTDKGLIRQPVRRCLTDAEKQQVRSGRTRLRQVSLRTMARGRQNAFPARATMTRQKTGERGRIGGVC